MENEIWKKIVGYNYYEINNFGKIRSLNRVVKHNYGGTAVKNGKILSPSLNSQGYIKYHLKEGKKDRTEVAHTLLWKTFVGDIPSGMQINHKDEVKTNNFICINDDGSINYEKSNLELCTPKYNTNYGTCIERRSKKTSLTLKNKYVYDKNHNAKTIIRYDKNGNYITEYKSIKEAAENCGITYGAIWRHINGDTKLCAGSIWKIKKAV